MSTAIAKAEGGAVAYRDPTDQRIGEIKAYIQNNRDKIVEACIQGVHPERLIRTAIMFLNSKDVRQTSKNTGKSVLECSNISILKAIINCARLGIDPSFGRAYLVPYNNEAELQIGYLGLIDLAKRSGEIKSITAQLVYEGDDFEVEFGTNPRFSHRPKFQGSECDFKQVYAIAMFDDGRFEYTVLSKDDVENVRKNYVKGDNPAWRKSYGEMAKKCAIRRLCKTLPLTIEARDAIEQDDSRNSILDVDVAPAPSGKSATEQLKQKIGLERKEPEVVDVESETDENDPDWFAKKSAAMDAKTEADKK
jgi:recombination protein RecT